MLIWKQTSRGRNVCLWLCISETANSYCVCVCVSVCVWQEAMVSELKNRNREIKEKRRLLKQDEVYHGALEDILLGKHGLHEYTICWFSP